MLMRKKTNDTYNVSTAWSRRQIETLINALENHRTPEAISLLEEVYRAAKEAGVQYSKVAKF